MAFATSTFARMFPEAATAVLDIKNALGLTAAATVGDVFRALKGWTSPFSYHPLASELGQALKDRRWNCMSLSRLLVITYAAARDLDPDAAGFGNRMIDTRKLSLPGIQANIASLAPNVARPDVVAEGRYTFSSHNYVTFGAVDYDLLMGTEGAAVLAAFPIDVTVLDAKGTLGCDLPAPPPPLAAAAPAVAAAAAAPAVAAAVAAPAVAAAVAAPAVAAAAASVRYHLRPATHWHFFLVKRLDGMKSWTLVRA